MLNLNKIMLAGNVGQEPEIGHTQGGIAFAKFSLAVKRFKKDSDAVTDWFRCSLFGDSVERFQKSVGKGQALYVEGVMETFQYTPEGLGKQITGYSVTVREFKLTKWNDDDKGQGQGQSAGQQPQAAGRAPAPARQAPRNAPPPPQQAPDPYITDDDVPF